MSPERRLAAILSADVADYIASQGKHVEIFHK